MQKIDEAVTALTTYYNRSYKRKARLRERAQKEGIDLLELHYAFRQRWIFSDYLALKAVIAGWKVFVEDLQAIQGKQGYENEWASAKEIESLITSRSFMYGLHFLFDVLDGLKRYSKTAQTSAGILIGKETFRKNLIEFAQSFKKNNGRYLTHLLQSSRCQDDGVCNITPEYFFETFSVKYEGITLISDNQDPLVFLRSKYRFLSNLENEIRKYFPGGSLKDFEIFVPKKLPPNRNNALTYGQKEIQSLAKRFDLNPLTASNEWVNLLTSMIEQDAQCKYAQEPETFWPYFLTRKDIVWGETIKRLIRIVLVLPTNSADAERSFSVMNHIKNDRRSRLSTQVLDHLMRLRINGPKSLHRFPATKYAQAWLKNGHMRTDSKSGQKRKHAESDEEDMEEWRNIFMESSLF